jgi:hypothetical protein
MAKSLASDPELTKNILSKPGPNFSQSIFEY